MTARCAHDQTLDLPGLDGANPLAFLAALGALRTLTLAWPEQNVRMSWREQAGAWRPVLAVSQSHTQKSLAASIVNGLPPFTVLFDQHLLRQSEAAGPKNKRGEPKWRDKLRFPYHVYVQYAGQVCRQANLKQRMEVDYAAAWASVSEIENVDNTNVARRTRFDFTAGNQAFVSMARDLWANISSESIEDALFRPWRYVVGGTSLRWDPLDEARRYALHASDPQDSTNNPILSVPAANVLALMALPLFPLIPTHTHTEQPGFIHLSDQKAFVWPIWSGELPLSVVASLLMLDELRTSSPSSLSKRGVAAVYHSRIILPSGRYRNFTPAKAI